MAGSIAFFFLQVWKAKSAPSMENPFSHKRKFTFPLPRHYTLILNTVEIDPKQQKIHPICEKFKTSLSL